MKTTNLNDLEQSFLNAVQKEHLTSYEILQRVEDVSDPIESLRGGTTYLNILYNRFEDKRKKRCFITFFMI